MSRAHTHLRRAAIRKATILAAALVILAACDSGRSPRSRTEAAKPEASPSQEPPCVTFDLSGLDASGLEGPPDGLVAVSYEFCVPKDDRVLAQVRSIDPTVQILPESPGRIGCRDDRVLCIGSTAQPEYRTVLDRLCDLEYVDHIDRCVFE